MAKQDSKRSEQDSLAPIQLDRLSVEDQREVASLGKGKGVQLLGVAAIVTSLGLGGAAVMRDLDSERAYQTAGAEVKALRTQHVDGFLRCALGAAYITASGSSERLHGALEGVSERYKKSYARTLRSCEPTLAALPEQLAALKAPGDLEPMLDQLDVSARALVAATDSYVAYLEDPKKEYDFVPATGHIDRIARAWADYARRDADFRIVLQSKL